MKSRKEFPVQAHVISNTHWDREWQSPKEVYWFQLVKMMDYLIEMMEKTKSFRYYHLDNQTIMLEDYFALRPEMEDRLKKLIRAGRIVIGPWYTLPAMTFLAGESIVGNLLAGIRITRELGGKHITGYTPCSSGQVSQMPQIMRGFSIDNIMFYRGNNRQQTPTEYIWEAPDGSRILGIRMAERFGRANFWMHLYRPAVFNKFPFEFEYEWDKDDQMPFRMADEDGFNSVHRLLREHSLDTYYPKNISRGARTLKREATRESLTNVLVYMDGHDQSWPHPAVARIVRDLNRLPGRDCYTHSNLADYMMEVKKRAHKLKLPVKHGEFRYTNADGLWCFLYEGTVSTRIYLKQANRHTEHLLQRVADPLASIAWMLGGDYPQPHLREAHKRLLANHAHDSIGGCSTDNIHLENVLRFRQADAISRETIIRSLGAICRQLPAPGVGEKTLMLLVFNPTLWKRSDVVHAVVDLPASWKPRSLCVRDSAGHKVPIEVLSREKQSMATHPVWEVGCGFQIVRFHVLLRTRDVPGIGYVQYSITPSSSQRKAEKKLGRSGRRMENEALVVTINANGTYDVLHKQTGMLYQGLGYFLDQGEVGTAWTVIPTLRGVTVDSRKVPARIRLVENSSLLARYEISQILRLPLEANYQRKVRNARRVAVPIKSYLTLRKGSPYLEVEMQFTNVVRDHKLTVAFPSDIPATHSSAEMPFDVSSREVTLPDMRKWIEPKTGTHPQLNFMDMSDGKRGMAILNRGLPEYCVTDDRRRTTHLTLIRTSRWAEPHAKADEGPWRREGEGAQCPGEHRFEYAIYPHAGDWHTGEVFRHAYAYNIELRLAQTGSSIPRKVSLPRSGSFINLEPSDIVLSTLKRLENGKGLLLRLFNPTDDSVSASLRLLRKPTRVQRVRLDEKPQAEIPVSKDGRIHFKVARKKITNLAIYW